MSQSFKDLFSQSSSQYAQYRPTYPKELFRYLASICADRDVVWDCGTGNGQAASELAQDFRQVIATDPSEKQIQQAVRKPDIEYRVASAEQSGLPNNSVNLVTVAQAFHWFQHQKFFAEVKRVGRDRAVLAVWSYGLTTISPEIDQLVEHLYQDILGHYWEPERRYVDSGYQTIQVPFQEVTSPRFQMSAEWSLEQLLGYLNTWSALQTYVKKNGQNPLESLAPRFQKAWGAAAQLQIQWPLSLRTFRIR